MKRKVYLFLVLLLASMGVAQAERYTLDDGSTTIATGDFVIKIGSGYIYNNNGTLAVSTTFPAEGGGNYLWTIASSGTGYTIKSKADSSLGIQGRPSGRGRNRQYNISLTSNPTSRYWDSGNNAFYGSNSGTNYYLQSSGTTITTSTTTGTNSSVTFYQATKEYKIVYDYYCNGTSLNNPTTTWVKEGDSYPTLDLRKTGLRAESESFYEITGLPEAETVAGDGTFNINLNLKDFPFNTTTIEGDGFAADTKYYTINLGGRYIYYNEEEESFYLSDIKHSGVNYQFAFTGNPITGYTIYNRKLGTSSVLYVANIQDGPCSDNVSASGTWAIGVNGESSIYLREIAGDVTNAYANNNNQNIFGFWLSNWAETDANSLVYINEVVEIPDWDVTLRDDAKIYVTGKADKIVTAESETDNYHWYILTQDRDDAAGQRIESMVYDNGVDNNMMRAASGVGAITLNGQYLEGNQKYLVRFIEDKNGMVRMQFATGNYASEAKTVDTMGDAGTYLFYNINGGNGHFGWNTSTTGDYDRQLDNNGAGYNVVLYAWGEVTATGGNNDWSVYEVVVEQTGVYTIECERTTWYDNYGILTTTDGNLSNSYYANKSDLNEPRQQAANHWALIYTPTEHMYVYNVGLGKYLNYVDGAFTFTDLPVSTNAHLMAATGTNKANYPYVLAYGNAQLNMAADNQVLIYNYDNDEGNMIRLVPVGTVEDETYHRTLYSDLLVQLLALKENPDGKTYFVLTDAAKTHMDEAIAAIRPDASTDYTQAQIDALQALLTEFLTTQSLYNMPENGRYFVRNYRNLTSNGELQHPYMANHYNLMGVGEALLSYYCVWDVTRTGDGSTGNPYTYTLQNEGQRFLGIPHDLGQTDAGYLGYQSKTNMTHFGCFTDTDEHPEHHALTLVPAQLGYLGYAAIQVQQPADGKLYAAFFDDNTGVGNVNPDGKYNTHDIMAGTLESAIATGDENAKQVFSWDFVKVTGTAEAKLFENQVNTALVGYAGGVVSISTAAAVEDEKETGSDWLQRVITQVNRATSNLSNNQGCGEPQDDDATVGGIGNMQTVFQTVMANRNGNDGIKSKLHIELKEGEHFYFESLRGDRPATHSRLKVNGDIFATVPQDQIAGEDLYQYMWYIEKSETNTSAYNCYTLDQDNERHYFTQGSGSAIPNPNTGDKLNFTLEEITPGIYLIMDADRATEAYRYLTIGGTNSEIEYFNKLEISSLWKLKTVTAKEVTLKADPEDKADYYAKLFSSDGNQVEEYVTKYTNAGKYADGSYLDIYGNPITSESVAGNRCYATYCPAIDMMIPEGANYKAYYVSGVVTNAATSETALGNCSVILKSVPLTQNKQFLKGGSGYILISQEFDTEQTSLVEKIDYSELDPKDVTAPEGNLLTGALVDVVSQNTDSSQPDYFKSFVALGYTATGKALGTNNSIPVYGEGLGFYNVKVGSKVDAGKSYMKLTDLEVSFHDLGNGGHVTVDAESASKQVAAMRFVIQEDEPNEETGIVPADTRPTDVRIYDISGRRVSKAGKGIYIVNGKKVIY